MPIVYAPVIEGEQMAYLLSSREGSTSSTWDIKNYRKKIRSYLREKKNRTDFTLFLIITKTLGNKIRSLK
jgi:hypothetical protein